MDAREHDGSNQQSRELLPEDRERSREEKPGDRESVFDPDRRFQGNAQLPILEDRLGAGSREAAATLRDVPARMDFGGLRGASSAPRPSSRSDAGALSALLPYLGARPQLMRRAAPEKKSRDAAASTGRP